MEIGAERPKTQICRQTTDLTPIINCYIVELDEKHYKVEKMTARYTNIQRFRDEEMLRARNDAIQMLLSKIELSEDIMERNEVHPATCKITIKLMLEFHFLPEMGDAEVYKPVQFVVFDNDNICLPELLEALSVECVIWTEAGLSPETQEITLSDKKATVISDMIDFIYNPMGMRYRKVTLD